MAIALSTAALGSAANGLGSATSVNFSTSAAVPSGGFITLAVTCYTASTGAVPTPSGGGLTWVLDASCDVGTSPGSTILYLFHANCPAGLSINTTITVNLDRAAFVSTVASAWSAGAAVSVDGATAHPAVTGTAWTSGNLTAATAAAVIVCATTENLMTTDASNPSAPASAVTTLASAGVGELDISRYAPGAPGTYAISGVWTTNPTANAATVAVGYTDTPPPPGRPGRRIDISSEIAI